MEKGSVSQFVRLPEGVSFSVCVGTEAGDPISEALGRGHFPSSLPFAAMSPLLRTGDRVLDIGAHIGSLALPAAAFGCRVLALEASPRNAALLQASTRLNGFNNLQVVHAAVSDRPGVVEFCPDGPWGQIAAAGGNRARVPVEAVTVDALLDRVGWDGVELLKLDVEGSEVAAVAGMSRLLSGPAAPVLIYESNGHALHTCGRTVSELRAAVEGHGYRLYRLGKKRLREVAPGEFQPDTVADYLAVKAMPAALADWPIDPPVSRPQLIEQVLATCAHPDFDHRAYIRQALREAPTWLRTHRAVTAAHEALERNPFAVPRRGWRSWLRLWLPWRRVG